DEWIGIRPGTDGLFAFALIHELLRSDRIDLDFLVRYANAHWLVVRNPGGADDGLFSRDAEGNVLCWARDSLLPHAGEGAPRSGADEGRPARADALDISPAAVGEYTPPDGRPALPVFQRRDERCLAEDGRPAGADAIDTSPAVVGEYTLPDGRRAVPAFQLLAERYLDPRYSPDAVSERCGIPADTIRRIARELAQAAFDSKLSLPIAWTDAWGREHAEMIGRPVAMHAMRGI